MATACWTGTTMRVPSRQTGGRTCRKRVWQACLAASSCRKFGWESLNSHIVQVGHLDQGTGFEHDRI